MVFSKADLASGYWHVKLDEDSSVLTKFQTCFGRYRYIRLPFGINGPFQYFQKKVVDALQDRHLNLFLLRSRERSMNINIDKLETKVESLAFV